MAHNQQYESIQRLPKTIFSLGTLTASYQFSQSLDLLSYDSVNLYVTIGTTEAVTANLKFQWSQDDVTWMDETTLTATASAGTEQPYTPYSKRIDLSMATAGAVYTTRSQRLAKYFRVALKSSGTTTGTIQVAAAKSKNSN